MAAFPLKTYQKTALDTLLAFAQAAQVKGAPLAFGELAGRPYNPDPFGPDVPCVCLRIPTGGGKTLLAAHAIPLLGRAWRASDAPVAVWLVPSDAIRAQTLKGLQTPGHPYRQVLADAYGERVQVCALEDVAQIAPPDWGRVAVVVVATIQSFRIDDTDKRNVYSFSESFERHFKAAESEQPRALAALCELPDALVTAEEATQDGRAALRGLVGQPRQSLANWLALHEPIVIVDEAHNTKTDKSFTALKRLAPSCLLELTATPIVAKSNVLYHVSAQELAAEHMIKLPIALAEHPEGWPQAVFAAVRTRAALEAEALKDEAAGAAYVRPIALYQAQNAGDAVPPEALRRHLIDELHIHPEEIVVATGSTRELDGLDLSARTCPVRHVITVQALREGWDCPFAYVLCSLQRLSSATAVEQLLGRVLRMPHATRRGREALNRAYAHVCEAEFSSAAHALADRLIHGMGFEALDVASMLAPAASLPLFEGNSASPPVQQASIATNFEAIDPNDALTELPGVAVQTIAGAPQVVVSGHIGTELEGQLLAGVRGAKKQEAMREQIAQHNALVAAQTAPSARGERFAPVPPLGYREQPQGELWPLEREAVLESVEIDLLTPEAIDLPGFQVVAQSRSFEIYLKDEHVKLRPAEAGQLAMPYGGSGLTAQDIVRWLEQSLYAKLPEFTPAQREPWFAAVVDRLLHEKGVPIEVLAQARFTLARALEAKAGDLRDAAALRAFRQQVLDGGWQVVPDWARPHVFEPGRYPAPAGSRYAGRYEFRKHYYPVIAELKEAGEEFLCAQLIDMHPKVKHWVRNLDVAPAGFWLPTSRGRFFADFVAELADGRVALLEYKGAHLSGAAEIEKRQIGDLWARQSGGRAMFGWLMQTQNGQSLAQQLDAALA
ncbi:DEAD/DEAH box helicase [Ottowia testudinis]|uniref:DEAD/DEAH box helicase family protein n=1 Tax=Ottowia testudinis TaxID=2816950 RepID=A0A975H3F9_9BURK|nr:DEAD/DEAH box helicase family protein [Ottowia testudinis]QTD45225.1 DEAD/DEAH box helicase family protein [Ottowia testudinis]